MCFVLKWADYFPSQNINNNYINDLIIYCLLSSPSKSILKHYSKWCTTMVYQIGPAYLPVTDSCLAAWGGGGVTFRNVK